MAVSLSTIKEMLDAVGLSDPRVLAATEVTEAPALLDLLFEDKGELVEEDTRAALQDFLDKIQKDARLAWLGDQPRFPGTSLDLALWASREGARKRRLVAEDDEAAASNSRSNLSSRKVISLEWRPTTKRQRLGDGLAARDRKVFERWCEALAAVLRGSRTPSWVEAASTGQPSKAMAGLVGKARPATLKKRVRTWQLLAKWLLHRRGRVWPTSAVDLIDYLQEGLDDDCPASFPEALRASVNWVESRSGLGEGHRFGRSEAFGKNVDRAVVLLSDRTEETKKAPRLFLAMVGPWRFTSVTRITPTP